MGLRVQRNNQGDDRSIVLITAPSVVRLGPYPPASVPRLPSSFWSNVWLENAHVNHSTSPHDRAGPRLWRPVLDLQQKLLFLHRTALCHVYPLEEDGLLRKVFLAPLTASSCIRSQSTARCSLPSPSGPILSFCGDVNDIRGKPWSTPSSLRSLRFARDNRLPART